MVTGQLERVFVAMSIIIASFIGKINSLCCLFLSIKLDSAMVD